MGLVTSSNLDYLITNVRMQVGDLDETVFSDSVALTALVSSVKYLQSKWSNRYLIYSSDMFVSGSTVRTPDGNCTLSALPHVNDIFRNCYHTFDSTPPPIIDQGDEYPIILSAGIFLRRSVITSSMAAFTNWSTPDLSYSNVQSSKAIMDLIKQDMDMLNSYFKSSLGRAKKTNFPFAAVTTVIID